MLVANATNGRGAPSPVAHQSSSLSDHEGLSQIKVELAEALRAKGQLQGRLKSAEETRDELRARVKADERLIKHLQAEKAILSVKVRDRDEEVRGKTQLLVVIRITSSWFPGADVMQEVQDENMSLNLQLNVAEQQSTKLKKENKELVDRWMARMGQEADAMNDTLKF